MLYHVARDEAFSFPDATRFRKGCDFGPALYCSFDEESAMNFYTYLLQTNQNPRFLVSDLQIYPYDSYVAGMDIYNFGIYQDVSAENAVAWIRQVLMARLIAYIDGEPMPPEYETINVNNLFYGDDVYRDLLVHNSANIFIGNRADSDVVNVLKTILEEEPVYGLMDDDTCLSYYDALNPLHFSPQIAFNEYACEQLFHQYPWREETPDVY